MVPGLASGVTMMATGPSTATTCALAGNVWCWGWNNVGQVGDGTDMEHDAPYEVPGL